MRDEKQEVYGLRAFLFVLTAIVLLVTPNKPRTVEKDPFAADTGGAYELWVVETSSKSLETGISEEEMAVLEPETAELVVSDPPQENIDISEKEMFTIHGVRITYYCPCSKCCGKWADGITSTGVTARAEHTIAVDPGLIPYGSTVRIGDRDYVAEDTGVSGTSIDIFVEDHKEALNRGLYYTDVVVTLP